MNRCPPQQLHQMSNTHHTLLQHILQSELKALGIKKKNPLVLRFQTHRFIWKLLVTKPLPQDSLDLRVSKVTIAVQTMVVGITFNNNIVQQTP